MNIELQWTPKDFHMPRTWNTCQGKLQTSTARLAIASKDHKTTGEGLPKPSEGHVPPPCAQDTRHAVSGFNVCPAGIQSCFHPILPFFAPFLSFEMGMLTLCHCILEVSNLFF
jgi:hypothetical protein